jgi:hypothetical protein
LVAQLTQLVETVQLHDEQIKKIIEVLQRMLEPPPEPKGRFGFYMPELAAKPENGPSKERRDSKPIH